jgi:hypothetical protein
MKSAEDEEHSEDVGPDELEVGVVADVRERQPADDNRRGRRDQVDERGRRLVAATRRAHQITYPIANATHIAIRNPIPFPIVIPAASEATLVVNGLTIEATTPVAAPRKMIAAATVRS